MLRKFLVLATLGLTLAAPVSEAYARAGGGSSFGSRGSRSWSTPAPTPTAPRSATPFDRPAQAPFNQGVTPQRAPGGFLSGGFGRGFLGGFLGAGLFGMMFGHGLLGGLGSITSLLGFLIQLGLIFLVVRFALSFFRRQPAMSGAAPMGGASYRSAPQGGAGSFGGAQGRASAGFDTGAPTTPVSVGQDDYVAFERRLKDVQAAFSAQDEAAMRRVATPEMTNVFGEQIGANQARGLVNRISDVKLVRGDLSEAWREQGVDYATVAMRFSMIDTMVDASGRVVSGSATTPVEATELWTFARPAGAGVNAWVLSAIQQAN